MVTHKFNHQFGLARVAGISQRYIFAPLIGLLAAILIEGTAVSREGFESQLKPGDIIYTDSGNGLEGGLVFKFDPETRQRTVISHGGYLGTWGYPIGIVLDRNGQLIVANEGCLLRIDPNTGEQTLIRDTRGASGVMGQ